MSNLLKNYNLNIETDSPRSLDNNELVSRRIEALAAKMERPENAGFVSGLPAEGEAVDELLFGDVTEGEGGVYGEGAEGEEGFQPGNIVKQHIPAVDTQAIIDRANADADEIIATARSEADRILAEASVQADNIRKSAHDEGYMSGHEEGRRAAEADYSEKLAGLDREKAALEDQYREVYSGMESSLVDTITDIYGHILGLDMKAQKEILIHLMTTTIRQVEGARSFLIHVSGENYELVSANKDKLKEAAALPDSVIEIVNDISLSGGDCLIETDGGIFDCGIGTELSELAGKLKMLSYVKN
ncbi:MAG: hypothetical protein K6G57_05320 [Lachnospiraceae bacterium]|nr:hypothetical protein [Lachnospiraceae bacterium]